MTAEAQQLRPGDPKIMELVRKANAALDSIETAA